MRLLPIVLLACAAVPVWAQSAMEAPPAWAHHAVWYQIFPERFRNGDASNDPTVASMQGAWPHVAPERLEAAGWQPTPWTHDWYEQEGWAKALGEDFYTTVQLRRYGGDLQGVIDALPYLDSLGVTALYLNPVNDAPSLHKYDARAYRHVDVHFGPDPDGDRATIAAEDPADPATWRFTAADSLLLRLIDEVHMRGMRIVLDYSWNHTGVTFWAWQDVLAHGRASRFADWYEIERFDDPATPDTNEFAYRGWAGVAELPELKKVDKTGDPAEGIPFDGDLHPEVKAHVFAVTRRWLDPNGDGDPSDGIDGVRLDVAEMVPLGFWRDYRRFVKGINPEALLVGEIWWQRWPDVMMDPRPYLGDVFDSVMNYRWFMPTRSLVTGHDSMTPSRYAAHLDSLTAGIDAAHREALMNVAATHDTPRLTTSLFNGDKRYKYRATPRDEPDYRIAAPDDRTRRAQRLLLALQFTLPGAPHVFYGDEVGMWGADDPDMRKPMVWTDLDYAPEQADPFGRPRPVDSVAVDANLLGFYRDLVGLRRQYDALFATGDFRWTVTDDARGLLGFRRTLGDEAALTILNLSTRPQVLEIEPGYVLVLGVGVGFQAGNSLRLGPRSATVLIR